MKHWILMICAPLALYANSIDLRSGVSAGESNNTTSANVLIDPFPGWAVDPFAHWISFENTGWSGIVVPNTDMSTPTAIFYQDFQLTEGDAVAGSIQIWADDVATVKLDGVVLFSANTVQGPVCAAGPIGCTQSNGGTISFNAPGLVHRLEFDVYQRGLATFGLLYDGHVDSHSPEPATVSIVGLGLAGLGLAALRRPTAPPR